ncbi:MAG: membrane protein insertase YidC [Bdellovibrionales bacterium]
MNNDNFAAAVLLSIAILVGFHFFYEAPRLEHAQKQARIEQMAAIDATKKPKGEVKQLQARDKILAAGQHVTINTPELRGSIQLKGALINDLALLNYRETVDPKSANIVLLSPAESALPYLGYYASFGWLAKEGVKVPDEDTVWKADRNELTPEQPVLLTWYNGQGLRFERLIKVDKEFMFTVTDRVWNEGKTDVTLYPFGAVTRYGKPSENGTYVLHQGPLGVLEGTLKEPDYDDLMDERKVSFEGQGGWLGFTDKYWLTALIPAQSENLAASFSFEERGVADGIQGGIFQADYRGAPLTLGVGAQGERVTNFFAGAKRVALLDDYATRYDIPLFDRAIDFGWYYYLTKPFLYLLHALSQHLGGMAWAIIVFTLLLKIVTLPLSLKSSRSMAKMKDLQPEIKAIQDRHKDDKAQGQLALMELYKREKVSPVSGCVPMLIQIPIFFALYKVLYVGIEMWHAPLFGWVHDMSMPDPSSVLTAFGALDFSFIPHVGVWPILMGLSMFLQQKMSPQPTDSSQAKIFLFLPIIFTFMMSKVAVGLIFYWTVSNILGIGQQWYVQKQVHK